MHIIPSSQIDFSRATLISSSRSPRQLFRLATHKFLIVGKDEPKLMLALESSILQETIGELTSDIVDVELTILSPLICQDSERHGGQEIEVRLYLKRGDTIVIHSNYGVMIL